MPRHSTPLSQVQYLALLCLAEHPVHGYGLTREIKRRTAGAVRPGPASIHRTLGHLLEAGLIVETDKRPDPAIDDPRRRYFAATPRGRRVLEAETERWKNVIAQAKSALSTGA